MSIDSNSGTPQTWNEYKALVLDKFDRIESSIERVLTAQSQTREDMAAMRQELRDLSRAQVDLRQKQGNLDSAMADLSRHLATLATQQAQQQSSCIRTTGHAELYKQVNDPKVGLYAQFSSVEQRVAMFARFFWLLLAACATAVVSLFFQGHKSP